MYIEGKEIVNEDEREEERACHRCFPESASGIWLLVSHGKDLEKHTFYSPLERRYCTRIIPELPHKKIWQFPSIGWWVLKDYDSDECCLLHLITMNTIQLPTLEPEVNYRFCILSAPPTDPNSSCLIVFIAESRTDELVYYTCRVGDLKFVKRTFSGIVLRCIAISSQHKIYGLVRVSSAVDINYHEVANIYFEGHNIQFNILRYKGQESTPPNFRKPPEPFQKDYLVESSGELLLVHQIYPLSFFGEVIDFRVFKFDTSNSTWVGLRNIGHRIIFLNEDFKGLCYWAKENENGNCIYYIKRGARSLKVRCYSLRDRSLSLSLPSPKISYRHPFATEWIMMRPSTTSFAL